MNLSESTDDVIIDLTDDSPMTTEVDRVPLHQNVLCVDKYSSSKGLTLKATKELDVSSLQRLNKTSNKYLVLYCQDVDALSGVFTVGNQKFMFDDDFKNALKYEGEVLRSGNTLLAGNIVKKYTIPIATFLSLAQVANYIGNTDRKVPSRTAEKTNSQLESCLKTLQSDGIPPLQPLSTVAASKTLLTTLVTPQIEDSATNLSKYTRSYKNTESATLSPNAQIEDSIGSTDREVLPRTIGNTNLVLESCIEKAQNEGIPALLPLGTIATNLPKYTRTTTSPTASIAQPLAKSESTKSVSDIFGESSQSQKLLAGKRKNRDCAATISEKEIQLQSNSNISNLDNLQKKKLKTLRKLAKTPWLTKPIQTLEIKAGNLTLNYKEFQPANDSLNVNPKVFVARLLPTNNDLHSIPNLSKNHLKRLQPKLVPSPSFVSESKLAPKYTPKTHESSKSNLQNSNQSSLNVQISKVHNDLSTLSIPRKLIFTKAVQNLTKHVPKTLAESNNGSIPKESANKILNDLSQLPTTNSENRLSTPRFVIGKKSREIRRNKQLMSQISAGIKIPMNYVQDTPKLQCVKLGNKRMIKLIGDKALIELKNSVKNKLVKQEVDNSTTSGNTLEDPIPGASLVGVTTAKNSFNSTRDTPTPTSISPKLNEEGSQIVIKSKSKSVMDVDPLSCHQDCTATRVPTPEFVTPVDIDKILRKNKKKLSPRCTIATSSSQTHNKGFSPAEQVSEEESITATMKSVYSCRGDNLRASKKDSFEGTVQIKDEIKDEAYDKDSTQMKNEIKYDVEYDELLDDLFVVEDNDSEENITSISQYVSNISKGLEKMPVEDPPPQSMRLTKQQEAIELIRRGLEMIKSLQRNPSNFLRLSTDNVDSSGLGNGKSESHSIVVKRRKQLHMEQKAAKLRDSNSRKRSNSEEFSNERKLIKRQTSPSRKRKFDVKKKCGRPRKKIHGLNTQFAVKSSIGNLPSRSSECGEGRAKRGRPRKNVRPNTELTVNNDIDNTKGPHQVNNLKKIVDKSFSPELATSDNLVPQKKRSRLDSDLSSSFRDDEFLMVKKVDILKP